MNERSIGKSTMRKESWEKVTGTAKYVDDFSKIGILHAKLAVSPHAHAKIISIDSSDAWKVPGVKAVLIGKDHPILTGSPLEDRPPIAIDKVRYYGEPVAIVVAEQEYAAEMAALLIRVEYELLPVLHSPMEAYQQGAPLLHEHLSNYKRHENVYPEPGTNIANRTKIRKGNMEEGWKKSDHIIDVHVTLPQSDHAAMETRRCTAEILPDGKVIISSASQSPYIIRRTISQTFHIPLQKIIVHTPLVGGSFGGKAAIQLEYLAYLASSAVGGKTVKLVNSREQDMISSPVHIGLDARIRLGCTNEGKLMAAEILFLFDSGAYSDRGAVMSRAGAADCTGPYKINNVHCDSLCMYTNHPYATSFRGFGIVMFNPDGSINLLCGAVEIGQGTRTALTQILSERLSMDDRMIHISTDVNTETDPQLWKTVASRSTFLVGNAVLAAAEDAIIQLKDIASQVLECSPNELDVGKGRVYFKNGSGTGIEVEKIANGYKFPDGHTIGGQVIGRGSNAMRNLTLMDPETGKGNPGPEWTVGAQAVEIELDTREYTYKIINAATVIDAGKVINPGLARGQITGGMSIGLSLASREVLVSNDSGVILNPQLRTYKLIRYGEQPKYFIDFVETPHLEAPYGLRGIGEHGVIGMPAALANSLSTAIGLGLNHLPLTPEVIWRTIHDSF
ncbi:xanthine dehydrogenase family protein molybdopterin-binding subunit [Paenibacillus sp. Soil787]|uniref:xanthine dehydrogenase family protein molybdopterin-binding subunit n=1 Tax=Paenibacillus sp. Soil787 TaxID=1736411 RepID=UPI0007038B62|nr:xanthine dehydrogenase family protein molybdopterin-binding subunit [Paenibacillus sp. Soil787]KRF13649.1 aldehyde oxidase [Paenibacillus sp. Soil787]